MQQAEMNQGMQVLGQMPGQLQFGVSIPQQQVVTQQQQIPRIPDIPMKQGEVMSQYQVRKQVYQSAFKELNDHDKAYCYANIYSNITFLSAKYPQSLTDKVMKYAPQV